MAKIDFGGISKEICLEYTPEAKLGEYALIHVGFAISLMDEEEAQETLKLIKEVAEFEDEVNTDMSASAPAAVLGGEDATLSGG